MIDQDCGYQVSVSYPTGKRTLCGRPACRRSQDRHYCRKHFDNALDEAKDEVVERAVKLMASTTESLRPITDVAFHDLSLSVTWLRKSGYKRGDCPWNP